MQSWLHRHEKQFFYSTAESKIQFGKEPACQNNTGLPQLLEPGQHEVHYVTSCCIINDNWSSMTIDHIWQLIIYDNWSYMTIDHIWQLIIYDNWSMTIDHRWQLIIYIWSISNNIVFTFSMRATVTRLTINLYIETLYTIVVPISHHQTIYAFMTWKISSIFSTVTARIVYPGEFGECSSGLRNFYWRMPPTQMKKRCLIFCPIELVHTPRSHYIPRCISQDEPDFRRAWPYPWTCRATRVYCFQVL